jgi:hypothetical protein
VLTDEDCVREIYRFSIFPLYRGLGVNLTYIWPLAHWNTFAGHYPHRLNYPRFDISEFIGMKVDYSHPMVR